MIKIRTAARKDIQLIDDVYSDGCIREGKLQFPNVSVKEMQQDLDKHKQMRMRNFLKLMSSNKEYWIVAEENEEIVAIGQAWIKNKEIGVIEKIYVDRKWTRQGIGTRMLSKLEIWLKSRRVKFIESSIYHKNYPSIKMHEKAKYSPISLKMRKKVCS